MNRITLPIDTKSLHYNIKNDNKSGHTATVATPLKQGNSIKEDLVQIYKIPHNIDFQSKAELVKELLKNTRTKIKITDVFVFDNISINGMKIVTDSQFCIFVREEIDPSKFQCGRIKVHYPTTLKYEDSDLQINNKEIMKLISSQLHDYAFLVNAFEYDFDTKTLNFKATVVGENQIPYSKVFINEKGVGNKFTPIFNESADTYDMEIVSMRENINYDIDPTNFLEVMQDNKEIAMKIAKDILLKRGAFSVRDLNKEYPYSLFDYEYIENNITKYQIVCYTSTKLKYFNLSIKRVKFCNDFCDYISVILITNINKNPVTYEYDFEEINSLIKSINSIMYVDGKENYE